MVIFVLAMRSDWNIPFCCIFFNLNPKGQYSSWLLLGLFLDGFRIIPVCGMPNGIDLNTNKAKADILFHLARFHFKYFCLDPFSVENDMHAKEPDY